MSAKVHVAIAALLVILAGCGGSPAPSNASAAVTVESDPMYVQLWTNAQSYIATHPNNLCAADPNAPPSYVSPGQMAYTVSPNGVTVSTVPDPDGWIPCPPNTENAVRCNSWVSGKAIYVAASKRYSDATTGYEMQNIILGALGYNTARR